MSNAVLNIDVLHLSGQLISALRYLGYHNPNTDHFRIAEMALLAVFTDIKYKPVPLAHVPCFSRVLPSCCDRRWTGRSNVVAAWPCPGIVPWGLAQHDPIFVTYMCNTLVLSFAFDICIL